MRTLGVIPARYASSRFPGKALAEIAGKPLIQWVYEGASTARLLDGLIVATDDERIEGAVRRFGGEAMMTSAAHPSGTDRVAEVARRTDAELIINIQGDEPLITGDVVDQGVQLLFEEGTASVGTLVCPLIEADELTDPGVVKVVIDDGNRALYFSRSPIPYLRGVAVEEWVQRHRYWKHIGLYVFRRPVLLDFVTWPVSPLEQAERLEQLRILEHGISIKVGQTDYVSKPVDTPADLDRVHSRLVRR